MGLRDRYLSALVARCVVAVPRAVSYTHLLLGDDPEVVQVAVVEHAVRTSEKEKFMSV